MPRALHHWGEVLILWNKTKVRLNIHIICIHAVSNHRYVINMNRYAHTLAHVYRNPTTCAHSHSHDCFNAYICVCARLTISQELLVSGEEDPEASFPCLCACLHPSLWQAGCHGCCEYMFLICQVHIMSLHTKGTDWNSVWFFFPPLDTVQMITQMQLCCFNNWDSSHRSV